MTKLTAIKASGAYKGETLFPHQYPGGFYVASLSKYKVDYVRVETLEELEALVRSGFGVRMSSHDIHQPPSRIESNKITIENAPSGNPSTPKTILPRVVEEVNLDSDSLSKVRKEQTFLRAYLTKGDSTGVCTICHEELPTELLVAAHIKRRSVCTNAERLDFDNVATLMCQLGCDDLFEKGYIFVSSSKVTKNQKRRTTPKLDLVINSVEGNTVTRCSSFLIFCILILGKSSSCSALKRNRRF